MCSSDLISKPSSSMNRTQRSSIPLGAVASSSCKQYAHLILLHLAYQLYTTVLTVAPNADGGCDCCCSEDRDLLNFFAALSFFRGFSAFSSSFPLPNAPFSASIGDEASKFHKKMMLNEVWCQCCF